MSITTSRRPNSLLDMVEVGGNYDHCCLKHYMCKIGILDFFANFKRRKMALDTFRGPKKYSPFFLIK